MATKVHISATRPRSQLAPRPKLPAIGCANPHTPLPTPSLQPCHHGLDGRTGHLLRGRARALGLRADSLALLLHTLQGVHHLSQYLATQGALTASIQPWPIVERFLKEQDDGAIGADVGCGNGKYLAVNERVFVVGSDRYVFCCLWFCCLVSTCFERMRGGRGCVLTIFQVVQSGQDC